MNPTTIAFGALPSPMRTTALEAPSILNKFVLPSDSYKTDMTVIESMMQYLLGICTTMSVVSYVEWLYWKKTGIYVKFSVAYLNYFQKTMIDQNDTQGSSIFAAFTAVQKYGICTEVSCPTNTQLPWSEFLDVTITEQMIQEASQYKIGWFDQIPVDPIVFAGALRVWGLIAVRFDCGNRWYTDANGNTTWAGQSLFPLQPSEVVLDGHANLLFAEGTGPAGAHDLFNNWNSWSKLWGSLDNNYDAGTGFYYHSQYQPTEAFVATIEPNLDASPEVSNQTVEELIADLKASGVIS